MTPEPAPRRRRGASGDPGLAVRKARDAALALPLVGLILVMPPVAQIFAIDARIGGVPVVLAYIFGVWILLVAGARSVGRRILETETLADPKAPPAEAQGGGEAV
ncbi:hypothetical protein M1105_04825 [Limibaculum sp. FT325]|uniref:hypothetical protein n=1 Tax=Thermohalobaculum sediminis TaxID=2939436 RepID=UPI0020BDFF87|nr:hypothetical protein [Limibaculum sediminis]MCL5776314.1 hypothetical protein [Limibaculum sediminis]